MNKGRYFVEKSNATIHTDGRQRRPFFITHSRKNKQEKPRKNHPFLRRFFRPFTFVRLHPLFLLLGVWYAVKGDLFLFLMSTLVALQHECAHAFAAAKLGYKLNAVVLMPFGAVIDGDLRSISLKDEIFVAICGPLCNLITAGFFVALWWITPTMYAFTDTACYSSLAVALVNLLPAYPLDGGRILRCVLARIFTKTTLSERQAEGRAAIVCRIITLLFAAAFFGVFIAQCIHKTPNLSVLIFGLFLLVGGLGNKNEIARYERVRFSVKDTFKRGAEIRRIAVLATCPIKDVLRFVSKGSYLILEVYDEQENRLFELSQNQFSDLFAAAKSPYEPIISAYLNYNKKG